MVEKKSKIFFIIFFSLVIISVVIAYNKYMINKDFEIFTDEEIFYESLEE